jgi:uncharacterized protein (TIGR03067 family)
MNPAILALGLIFADGGESTATYNLVGADDRAELERGEWAVVKVSTRGKELPPARLQALDMRMVFQGDTLTQKTGGANARPSTFRLNTNGRPKELDWGLKDVVQSLGIYQLDGDTLKIAMGRGTRPKGFDSDNNSVVYTLKRVAPGAPHPGAGEEKP